ncbi:HNH endonuclease [Pectobacterium aroidearum]|uniref:HNH endonuclease n=1 Tax=Pectobacterium aroidearum TaxID=1201031 RepID=UPI0015F54F96|nr:HNH endonuclease [Pectobacterium aroidearum]MBA5601739.1 HNH endonuclease [Pectobacterium aroidearum]
MFNVTRTQPSPPSLANNTSYRYPDVIQALQAMFHGKCYLCEQDSISDPEVEHFVPHGENTALKFGWNNLFYSCRRCNGIKSNTHRDLLDCTDSRVNVFEEIVHYAGNAAVGEIEIKANLAQPSKETINTVDLLKKCFNEETTGLKAVSKESLLEKLLDDFNEFMTHRNSLVNKRSTSQVVSQAKESLMIMCSEDYPFSVFWKWHILKDPTIERKFPAIRNELNF